MSPPGPPRILAIGGSDPSGSAGIQADIKTITMLGGYAMTAITAVTVQNTLGVSAIQSITPSMVQAQARAVLDDIGADIIKTGMLGDAEMVRTVARLLTDAGVPAVVDPVMVATSGDPLLKKSAIVAYEELLFPKATLVTPNLDELRVLSGMPCGKHHKK